MLYIQTNRLQEGISVQYTQISLRFTAISSWWRQLKKALHWFGVWSRGGRRGRVKEKMDVCVAGVCVISWPCHPWLHFVEELWACQNQIHQPHHMREFSSQPVSESDRKKKRMLKLTVLMHGRLGDLLNIHLLFCWQNKKMNKQLYICKVLNVIIKKKKKKVQTWNEHMRVSSTLIIAPALSNSPQ